MAFRRIILHLLITLVCVYVSYKRNMAILEQRQEFLSNFSSPYSNRSLSLSKFHLSVDPWKPIHALLLSAKNKNKLEAGNCSSRLIEYDFYRDSCPKAEQIVRSIVEGLHRTSSEVAPALLRLLFHDCFIHGCDASVLLDSTEEISSEKESPPNESLRGFSLIDTIKSKLEEQCPRVVSCADILVLAARDSVALSGGPFYPVYTGRRDSTVAFADLATAELPDPYDRLPVLLASFASRGFDGREMVSLLGAHSIGVIHCKFIEKRLYHFDGSHMPDPSLDIGFLDIMRTRCNNSNPESSQGPKTSLPDSPSSRTVHNTSAEEPGLMPMTYKGSAFGTQYYHSLLQRRGILYADQQLMATEETGNWVRAYASGASLFRRDFALVMMKLSDLQVLTAPMGQIRLSCSKVA